MDALDRFELREYELAVAGLALRVIGPRSPDLLLEDPDLERRFSEDEYLPYWATPWPASILLASYVVEHHAPREGRALELGCGLAIASLALAQRGFDVTASDYEPQALRFAEKSAALNGVALKTAVVDWRQAPSERYGLIVAADVLYEPHNAQPLAAYCAAALARRGTVVIADPGRPTSQRFVDAARTVGLACERVALDVGRVPIPESVGKAPPSASVFVARRTA